MIIVPSQKIIAENVERGTDMPPLLVDNGGEPYGAHEIIIKGQDGLVAAIVRYDPELPLLCGCHVSIEVRGSMVPLWREMPDDAVMVPCKGCGDRQEEAAA